MAVSKERVALQSKENLDPKEELQNLMNQLKQLTDSGEGRKKLSKKLNEGVSLFLKNHQDVVGTVKKIYEGLDSDSKEGLQSLMKLAKVDEEVRDEQREINVRLEALREQQALSEEIRKDANKLRDAVKVQLTTKINELYSKGDYQGALDNAVYLLSAEDKVTAFSMIKAILKATPSNETLYIKDKKISYSKRREWIQKMENNFEAAAREFQASYYPDVSISDEWTLDESSKKHSDKKAAKLLDKELSGNKDLYDITKRVNVPSAGNLIEKNYVDIKKIFDESRKNHPETEIDKAEKEFKSKLNKEFFVSHGYLPKSGEKLLKADDLKDKEWESLVDLCIYRIGVDLETPVEGKPSAKAAYDALVLSQVAGVSTSELEQARTVLGKVDFDKFKVPEGLAGKEKEEAEDAAKQKAKEALMTLLGDLNWDARVTNTSRKEGVDREGLDKGTLFGGQIASMFDGAINRFGEQKVVQNVVSIIDGLNGLRGFKADPETIVGLISAFKDRPEALIAFRSKLMNEPDSGMSMFNVGSAYVDRKIGRLKSEEKFRQELTEFLKTKAGEKVEEQLDLHFDNVFEEEIVKNVLPNLIKFKESAAYDELTKGQKQHIENLIKQLSTPEGRREFLSDPEVKSMYRNFIISGLGINFTDIKVDGEDIYGVGVGTSVSSEKLNDFISRLTNDIFNKASGSVGLYCADGNVSLGLGLGFGASKNLGDNARVFYNAGTSWSPFSPKGLSFSGVVGEETRVNPKARDSLDLNAAHYIGVAGAYGLGLNLSDPNFNTNNISLSVYWNKNKLEGVKEKAEQVKQKMAPIFEHLFETQGEITVESILQNLRGGKMNDGTEFSGFSNTSGETLYKTAVAIYNMINSYKLKLGCDDKAAIKELSENFAVNLSRDMENKDIEKIVDEGIHLSGASIGVSLSFARLFTGFFISGGLTFTRYEDSKYNEDQDMLIKAEKGMENPDNYEVITNGEKTYKEKMNIINKFLHGNYLEYSPASAEEKIPASITLSKDVFGKDIKVLCHPDLAPYIIQDNGEIKLPGNADISLAKIMHQGKAEYTLILGNDSSNKCEAVTLENDKLKWEGNSTVEFGSKKDEFEKYNTVIEITQVEKEVGIDGKPSGALLDYLKTSKGSDALVNYRLSGQWKKFAKFIKDNPGRGGETEAGKKEFIEKAKSYLPSSLKTIDGKPAEFTVEDIRFIYASLSRVSQTRDKQLEGETLGNTARDYLVAIRGLSEAQKTTLNEYINKVSSAPAQVLSKTEWENMAKILKVNINEAWNRIPSKTNERKLFNLLTPIRYLADKRTDVYVDKIRSEYKSLPGGADVLINARKQALEKLNGKPTATGVMKEKRIGAVAGYDLEDQIDDKFLSSPKIVEGSEYVIDNNTENINLVKQHYLEELAAADWAQLAAIRDQIVVELEKSVSDEDKKLAATWKAYKFDTDVPSRNKFVEELLKTTTKDKDGHDIPKVSFNLSYAFFADCVNETILLGNIKITTLEENQKQAPHDVHYYDAIVANNAVTTARSLSIGATYGEIKTKQLDMPEDEPEPEEPKEPEKPEEPGTEPVETPTGSTEPFVDTGSLQNASEVDFDGRIWKIGNNEYLIQTTEVGGNKCLVAFDASGNGNVFIVVKNSSGGVELVPFDGKTWPSVLANGTEVDMKNHENFLNEHKQWEDRVQKYKNWEEARAKWKVAHDKWVIDHKKWVENHGDVVKKQEEYLKRYEEIIKALPTIEQAVARDIVLLNYQIMMAKPGESSDLINKRNELMKQVDSSIIDRLMQ